MFKKIIFNTGSQVVGKIVSACSTLIITLLIGRSLGPAGFGEFTKIFVFIGYFYTFVDFGFNSIYVKEKSHSDLFRILIGLRIILSLILAIVAVIISFLLPFNPQDSIGFSPQVKIGIQIASLTIITQALFTSANAIFQKRLRYDLSAIAIVFGSIVMIAGTLFLYLTTRSLLAYIFVYILGGITYVLTSLAIIAKKFKQSLSPLFDKEQFKALIFSSWPIGIALILNLVYFRVDVFILSNSRSSAEVGLYGLAFQFFQAALAVPIFFANALYPILSNLYQKSISEFNKTLKFWLVNLIIISLGLSAFLFIISYLIPIIYDSRFTGSGTALRIFSLGMPFFFISALFWHQLIIYNKQKLLIYIYAAGAIFNLITNLIFIPTYGYIAASYITVISEILVTILLILSLRANPATKP